MCTCPVGSVRPGYRATSTGITPSRLGASCILRGNASSASEWHRPSPCAMVRSWDKGELTVNEITEFLNSTGGLAVKGALVAAFLDFAFGIFAAVKDGTFAIDAVAAFL